MPARLIFLVVIVLLSCQVKGPDPGNNTQGPQAVNYSHDLAFLKTYDPTTLELTDKSGESRVIVSAKYQGRVMTSTSAGEAGNSYGWLNYDLIASNKFKEQFNPVGGEERFWLGPEGGQYSLYFAPGDSFNIANWQVPALIDTLAYDMVEKAESSAVYETAATVTNYSGTTFDLKVRRKIELLGKDEIESGLGSSIPEGLRCVGYRTVNSITNNGDKAWQKETGLISIWLLGMFTPSPETTVIIPILPGGKSFVTTDYFGDILAERLDVRDDVLLFRCDGQYRSKVGLSPAIAKPLAGSYDAGKKILTIISFKVEPFGDYVNSKWEIQDYPYKGDALNSYNDGPLQDGSQLGPFYELESSSPAMQLRPGETQTYSQVTCHFEGDEESLQYVAKQLLGFDIEELTTRK